MTTNLLPKLAEEIRREADISARTGQLDRLNAIADKLEAHHAELEAVVRDAERLMYAFQADGFTNVEKDRYDYAMDCADENGRDEPNKEDELNGVRRLIDQAMRNSRGRGKWSLST